MLTIKVKHIELTVEEARELYRDLKFVFESKPYFNKDDAEYIKKELKKDGWYSNTWCEGDDREKG